MGMQCNFIFLAMLLCIWLLYMLIHDDRYILLFLYLKNLVQLLYILVFLICQVGHLYPHCIQYTHLNCFVQWTYHSIEHSSYVSYSVSCIWLFQFISISLAISVAISWHFFYFMC